MQIMLYRLTLQHQYGKPSFNSYLIIEIFINIQSNQNLNFYSKIVHVAVNGSIQ